MEPLSIRADFLRPAAPEPIDIEVELVRTGSRVAVLAATASIGAKPIARAVMAFGRPIESSLVSEHPSHVRMPDDATPLLPRTRRT
jgi:acyl-CoA thioesterase